MKGRERRGESGEGEGGEGGSGSEGVTREEREGNKAVERRGQAERASGLIGASSANHDEGDPAERRRGRLIFQLVAAVGI